VILQLLLKMKFKLKERPNLTQDRNEKLKLEFTGTQKFSFEGCICGGGDYTNTIHSLNLAKESYAISNRARGENCVLNYSVLDWPNFLSPN
jgi:hypothetical protein